MKLLKDFLSTLDIRDFSLEELQNSNSSTVYRIISSKGDFIYKIRSDPHSAKAINELLALEYLSKVFPNNTFSPHSIWNKDNEFIATYLEGKTCYPEKLSEKQTRSLTVILDTLNSGEQSETFTLERMDKPQKGSSLDITKEMWYNYAIPRLESLRRSNISLAKGIEQKCLEAIKKNSSLLRDKNTFSFMHYDLVNNILVNKDKAMLIDWEKSGFGDPAYNLAVLETIGKLSTGQAFILQEDIKSFANPNFVERFKFFRILAITINYLWLYQKRIIEKVQPETYWQLEDLQNKLEMEVLS